MRDLTLKDVEHLTVRSGCHPVDVLAMVCQVAFDIYQQDEFHEEAATHNTNHNQKKKKTKKRKQEAVPAIILPGNKRDNIGYGYPKSNNHYDSSSFVYYGPKPDDDQDCKFDHIRKGKSMSRRDHDDYNEEKLATTQKELTKRPTKRRVWFENSAEERGESSNSASAAANKNKKKKVVTTKIADHGPNPAPDMSQNLKNRIGEMGGCNVKLVVQKRLYKTDTTTEHNRFSIPLSQVREKFLTENEEAFLNSHSGKNVAKMDVRVIEPNDELVESKISLRRWNMNKESGSCSSSYVLAGSWNNLVSKNRIEPGMVLQLWSFRVGQELCLALVRLP